MTAEPAATSFAPSTSPAVQHDRVAVSIRSVTKAFGDVRVLDKVSLDIREGEFFSLLGPSGCGKTTLLRIIGGFEQPQSGDIWISGRSALADPPYRRRTNMIFQHLALFPHLSVSENIAFGLEMKRLPRKVIEEKGRAALDLVRMSDYAGRRIDELSGGQKQRIAMARALVNEPDVLLLDEPLGALDLRLRLQMQEELRRIHRATGKTFIFVTHDQGEAMTMSDRIAIMSSGEVIQVGTPRDVYERPATRFVAEFLGSSNLLIGKIERRDDDGMALANVQGATFLCRAPVHLSVGSEVLIAIRYEKVEVLPAAAVAARGDLEGTIVGETYMGSATRFEVAFDNGLSLLADVSNSGRILELKPESRVRVRWSAPLTVLEK